MTEETDDWSTFFCPNENCPDHGKVDHGNIRLKEHYGKNNTTLLRCTTCKKCFSETRGTPFFRLHTSPEKVLQVMAMFAEKGSICGTARACGVDKEFHTFSRVEIKHFTNNWMKC